MLVQVEHVFSTQTQGTCQDQVTSSQLCYEAAASVASPDTVTTNITTHSQERSTFTLPWPFNVLNCFIMFVKSSRKPRYPHFPQ